MGGLPADIADNKFTDNTTLGFGSGRDVRAVARENAKRG